MGWAFSNLQKKPVAVLFQNHSILWRQLHHQPGVQVLGQVVVHDRITVMKHSWYLQRLDPDVHNLPPGRAERVLNPRLRLPNVVPVPDLHRTQSREIETSAAWLPG